MHLSERNGHSPTERLMQIETGAKKTQDSMPVRIIENNIITGFPIALWVRTLDTPRSTRLLIENNTTDGILRVEGLDNKRVFRVDGNLDNNTFKPIKPQLLLQKLSDMPDKKNYAASESNELNEDQRDEDSESMR